jgi:hypothetical protein
MFCESDQASLCWDCDEKVHSANFLVAKHCRTLLCQVCQSPTPWKSSGSKLAPTVSVCESCFAVHKNNKKQLQDLNVMARDQESREAGNDYDESENDREFDDDDTDDDSDEYDEEEDEEEDGDNQVVPWSGLTASSSPSIAPPVASSSSSEEEISCAGGNGFLKRMRDSNVDLDSDVSLFFFFFHFFAIFFILVFRGHILIIEFVDLRKYWVFFLFLFRLQTLGLVNTFNVG